MKMWRGGAQILCVCSGALKNRWGQGEGVKSGCRTDYMSRASSLCRKPSTLVKCSKNSTLRLYDNKFSPVSWDPSIVMPGFWAEIFQVIMLAARAGESTKRKTGQRVTHCSCTLLPWLMWSGPYCCIVTQFERESFGICRFRGSCMRGYDLIYLTQGFWK